MTCQHCQTWNLDDDHRCRRCGRRIRSTPSRISPDTYPIAATATARAYDFDQEQDETPVPIETGQQPLFPGQARSNPIPLPQTRDSRMISFGFRGKGESTRARVTEIARPAPLKVEKIEVSPRTRRAPDRKAGPKAEQQRLDLFGKSQVLTQPQSSIICDAPVAPNSLRSHAALIDTLIVLVGCAIAALAFYVAGGSFAFDRHVLPFALCAIATIPVAYKLLWSYAGLDTIGMHAVGLRLIDFDGNSPSRDRRLQRTFGSFISLLAAGIGLVWVLVDQDSLAWHDHISGTFPTLR
jgi:uncharacterized RDD family membrane protein YckC